MSRKGKRGKPHETRGKRSWEADCRQIKKERASREARGPFAEGRLAAAITFFCYAQGGGHIVVKVIRGARSREIRRAAAMEAQEQRWRQRTRGCVRTALEQRVCNG